MDLRDSPAHSRAARALAAAMTLAGAAAQANVDVMLVAERPVYLVGETAQVRIVLAADSPQPESIASARVLLNWNPAELRLLGHVETDAVPLMNSGFPIDPNDVNESTLPQDGTALFLAFAPLAMPIAADQDGVLLGTLLFECLAPVSSLVDIPLTAGDPETQTTIFDGGEPNLDITGDRFGATVVVVSEPSRLRLDVAPDAPVDTGDPVTVRLWMENLHGQPAAGFQAFLGFDPAELVFVEGSYPAAPFGLPLIEPIASAGGTIDLAAGIDPLAGQPPSAADALLATISFQAARPGCVSSVRFRDDAEAASLLSSQTGEPLVPFALFDPLPTDPSACACPCELDGSAGIDVFDLLAYLDLWFPGDAAAERTNDVPASVDVFDLLVYLDCWFAPPAGCQ